MGKNKFKYENCSEIIETPAENKLLNKLQIVFVVM